MDFPLFLNDSIISIENICVDYKSNENFNFQPIYIHYTNNFFHFLLKYIY